MRLMVKIAFFIALVVSIIWLIFRPGYDSAATAAGSFAALLASFFLGKESAPPQSQNVSGNSTAIQAGRDAKVDNFKRH